MDSCKEPLIITALNGGAGASSELQEPLLTSCVQLRLLTRCVSLTHLSSFDPMAVKFCVSVQRNGSRMNMVTPLMEAGTRWFKSLQSAEANVVNNMHSNGPWHAEGHARERDPSDKHARVNSVACVANSQQCVISRTCTPPSLGQSQKDKFCVSVPRCLTRWKLRLDGHDVSVEGERPRFSRVSRCTDLSSW